jgi:hypothetical protein
MIVKKTKNYEAFEIRNNRRIDLRHVEALKKSILTSDHTESHPISVKIVEDK